MWPFGLLLNWFCNSRDWKGMNAQGQHRSHLLLSGSAVLIPYIFFSASCQLWTVTSWQDLLVKL